MAVDELRVAGIFHDERAAPEPCAVCGRSPVVHRLRVRLDEFDSPRPDIRTLKARIHCGERTDGIAEYWLCDDCGHLPMEFKLVHNEDGDGLSVVHLVSGKSDVPEG
jgi:hypothetical protein